MKYLVVFLLALTLISCEKEQMPLNFINQPEQFNYDVQGNTTTILYSYNKIKSFDFASTNTDVRTAFAAEISIGYVYVEGETYLFLAKEGKVYAEHHVPFFTSAQVISNTLYLYYMDDDVYTINLR